MPKKSNNKKQTKSYSVKANEILLKEARDFLINNPVERNNLISAAINNKNLRIFELFEQNNGKLTVEEALENFEYIATNDRVDILKYFLETLKLDLNKPIKDSTGENSILHTAVLHGAKECIKYLISKNYDINKPASNNYLPIDYAILSGRTEIAKLLIQKGVQLNERIIYNLANAYQHDEAVRLLDTIPSKFIKLNSYLLYNEVMTDLSKNLNKPIVNDSKEIFSPLLEQLASIEEEAKPKENYYKLILGKEYHLLPKAIEEKQKFIDSKIFQLNSTANHNHDTRKTIIGHIFYTISSAINIYEIFKFNERGNLEKYILKTLEKNKNLSDQFSTKLLFFCSNLMKEIYDSGGQLETIKYAKIIEENPAAIKILSKEAQSIIFFNLGEVYSNHDSLKALDYLSKAEQLNPNNSVVVEKKYSIYLQGLKNPEMAIAEAEKITDNDLKSLLIIHAIIQAYQKFPISQDIGGFNNILLNMVLINYLLINLKMIL